MNNEPINKTIETLASGGIIAYPTDTLYGIGCDALNEETVRKVYEIKGRNFSKPMSIAVSSIEMMERYVTIPINIRSLLKKIVPGPYTILLQKKDIIPDLVTSGSTLVGVRIPDHDLILEIIERFGKPIITTSANLSGENDVTKYEDITLPVDYIVKGQCKYNQPSTVFDPINKKILRKGARLDEINKILNN